MVTGGNWGRVNDMRATKYNLTGFMEDLPALNYGRKGHACAWYMAEGDTLVYLVTGGWNEDQHRSDTEILRAGSLQWIITSPLPYGIYGLRAVTLDNVPFLFGKIITFRPSIIRYSGCYTIFKVEKLKKRNLCQIFLNWTSKPSNGSTWLSAWKLSGKITWYQCWRPRCSLICVE